MFSLQTPSSRSKPGQLFRHVSTCLEQGAVGCHSPHKQLRLASEGIPVQPNPPRQSRLGASTREHPRNPWSLTVIENHNLSRSAGASQGPHWFFLYFSMVFFCSPSHQIRFTASTLQALDLSLFSLAKSKIDHPSPKWSNRNTRNSRAFQTSWRFH